MTRLTISYPLQYRGGVVTLTHSLYERAYFIYFTKINVFYESKIHIELTKSVNAPSLFLYCIQSKRAIIIMIIRWII
ncbi:hypothetical protein MBAV_000905 [Candidatus Magnetobacterium bavaricum]|uniref:Uncharacterized protein n=1 Tax=Candidatus Magnetobacterium bavaricum TaxID=29290 RepID=A0A0F3GY58_9BACT|nr:hypothetical protein MBAV_000905 [Candidatus Magnetobacterium bavaricum]